MPLMSPLLFSVVVLVGTVAVVGALLALLVGAGVLFSRYQERRLDPFGGPTSHRSWRGL